MSNQTNNETMKTDTKQKLTKAEFIAMCAEYYIYHPIALENDAVVEALRNADRDALRDALENEF